MRVLVTGATGNLGTALVEAGGLDVVPVGRLDWPRLPGLLDSGIEAVLHAAWDLHTPVSARPSSVMEANLLTTARLLEATRDSGIPKFALVSSCAVYGESTNTAEDAPCCPVTLNGITKLLNERLVEEFCASNGIECQIYRPFNTFGGRDRFSIVSRLRRALEDGTPFVLNNDGRARRDFIHVRDTARVVTALLTRRLDSIHVNVGTGRATQIRDIVAVVQQLHPELLIEHRSVREAEYSQADVTRLRSILGDERFMPVLDFVEESLRHVPAAPG